MNILFVNMREEIGNAGNGNSTGNSLTDGIVKCRHTKMRQRPFLSLSDCFLAETAEEQDLSIASTS